MYVEEVCGLIEVVVGVVEVEGWVIDEVWIYVREEILVFFICDV